MTPLEERIAQAMESFHAQWCDCEPGVVDGQCMNVRADAAKQLASAMEQVGTYCPRYDVTRGGAGASGHVFHTKPCNDAHVPVYRLREGIRV